MMTVARGMARQGTRSVSACLEFWAPPFGSSMEVEKRPKVPVEKEDFEILKILKISYEQELVQWVYETGLTSVNLILLHVYK